MINIFLLRMISICSRSIFQGSWTAAKWKRLFDLDTKTLPKKIKTSSLFHCKKSKENWTVKCHFYKTTFNSLIKGLLGYWLLIFQSNLWYTLNPSSKTGSKLNWIFRLILEHRAASLKVITKTCWFLIVFNKTGGDDIPRLTLISLLSSAAWILSLEWEIIKSLTFGLISYESEDINFQLQLNFQALKRIYW